MKTLQEFIDAMTDREIEELVRNYQRVVRERNLKLASEPERREYANRNA